MDKDFNEYAAILSRLVAYLFGPFQFIDFTTTNNVKSTISSELRL